MVKNILIPTDGSDYGKTAIAYGIHIARKLEAQLTGLHVVDVRLMQSPVVTDISGAIGLPPYQEFLPVIENGLNVKAESILKEFREQCEAGGVHAETKKVMGVIDETIIEEGKVCDWILLAQRGEHFHIGGRAILGSTAQSVVRRSGKPVLVTPEHFREIESMAVAYDGSIPAHKALKLAAELSEAAAWPLSIIIITDDQPLGANLSEQAEALLDPFKIDSAILILGGKNEDKVLLRFIQEGSVELLVMGAYGHNRLRELLVGSTTSTVIRKSTIPVLLTR